ncbi:group 1 truncated hemoglobin [Salinarimonas sp.]|uniref:group I truncated hemoglobin n=1 Tax=Salinarimonas sp. TaxID=2766526 RepID=UPI0032D8BB49
MPETLFERCGGAPGVSRLVMALYDRVLVDDRLHGFFAETDMRRLVDHHAKFLSALMGGPAGYDERLLADVHAGLGIAERDFAAMLDALRATLAEGELSPEEIARVLARYQAYKAVVVQEP